VIDSERELEEHVSGMDVVFDTVGRGHAAAFPGGVLNPAEG